ncbi:MAG: hypothetical protein ACRD0H_07205, partial [Actinomycetes bacterium]
MLTERDVGLRPLRLRHHVDELGAGGHQLLDAVSVYVGGHRFLSTRWWTAWPMYPHFGSGQPFGPGRRVGSWWPGQEGGAATPG